MSEQQKLEVGRLALRVEGSWWNAYYTLDQHSMENAKLLGTIHMDAVANKDRKHEFMALMQNVVADFIEEVTGHRPSFPRGPEPAPEHERSGLA